MIRHRQLAAALWLIGLAGFVAGCAASAAYPRLQAHPGTDRRIDRKDIQKVRGVKSEYRRLHRHHVDVSRGHALVLESLAPEGINFDLSGMKIEEGYDHEPILQFWVGSGPSCPWALGRFAMYRDQWRRSFCHPQVALHWGTLGTWSLLSPVAAPCWSNSILTEKALFADLRKLARAAGGDLAIVSTLRDQHGQIVNAHGFIVEMDPSVRFNSFEVEEVGQRELPPL